VGKVKVHAQVYYTCMYIAKNPIKTCAPTQHMLIIPGAGVGGGLSAVSVVVFVSSISFASSSSPISLNDLL